MLKTSVYTFLIKNLTIQLLNRNHWNKWNKNKNWQKVLASNSHSKINDYKGNLISLLDFSCLVYFITCWCIRISQPPNITSLYKIKMLTLISKFIIWPLGIWKLLQMMAFLIITVLWNCVCNKGHASNWKSTWIKCMLNIFLVTLYFEINF